MSRLVLFLSLLLPAFAQEPVRYRLTFPWAAHNYVHVEATFPSSGPSLELFMPVWTPGSYLVREYARNVEDFRTSHPWTKSRKNRWLIQTGGASSVTVSYRVYAREPAVQGNWVDAGFAMLNGAPTFMTRVGDLKRPHEVTVVLPPQWTHSLSGMPGANNRWTAADYDELVDSPIYAGSAPVEEFEVAGIRHYLVNEGGAPVWDGPASAQAVKKIVEECARMWGGLPYPKYVFFNMLTENGGGLEHRTSTWMNASRWAWSRNPPDDAAPQSASAEGAPRAPSRVSWLGLVSHEYFHAWNVKRLRPVELGPFDYENEVHTRSLWIAEGFTSYYGPLILRRAGLTTRDQFLRSISQTINQLQTTPGRLQQPVETASYDAWIKHYRPDANSPNTAISYYTKGAVIGLLLDARVRQLTGGAKSLDDVMKLAFQRYSGERGFTPAEFRQTASEVAGADLGPWFVRVLETTEELDYAEMLDTFGLQFRPARGRPRVGNLGLVTANNNGRLLVTQVRRGAAGFEAGFNVDDEILAINEFRVRADQFASRLESYQPGDTLSILTARRDRLMTLKVTLTADPQASWQLEPRAGASADQKSRLASWLREAN